MSRSARAPASSPLTKPSDREARSLVLLVVSLLALGLLAWFGGAVERLSAALFLVVIFAPPLVEPLTFQNWRYGVGLVDLLAFLALWGMAERWDRWWLTAAAGFQLIVVLTFAIPWLTHEGFYLWTEVAVRRAGWGLILLSILFGAWESWAARRFAREAINAGTNF